MFFESNVVQDLYSKPSDLKRIVGIYEHLNFAVVHIAHIIIIIIIPCEQYNIYIYI